MFRIAKTVLCDTQVLRLVGLDWVIGKYMYLLHTLHCQLPRFI